MEEIAQSSAEPPGSVTLCSVGKIRIVAVGPKVDQRIYKFFPNPYVPYAIGGVTSLRKRNASGKKGKSR